MGTVQTTEMADALSSVCTRLRALKAHKESPPHIRSAENVAPYFHTVFL